MPIRPDTLGEAMQDSLTIPLKYAPAQDLELIQQGFIAQLIVL